MVRFLDPADYVSMPWKNGGGRTTEIAVHPPGADAVAFAWRVSVAEVARDGAFSRYSGVERTIVLLDGAGMWLSCRGHETELRTPFEPYRFSGDDAVDCTLVAGPVRDFNAMFRRGAARGTVGVVRGDPVDVEPADFVVAYAAAGAHDCAMPGHAPRVLATGHAVLVERTGDTDPAAMRLAPSGAGAVALVVRIDLA